MHPSCSDVTKVGQYESNSLNSAAISHTQATCALISSIANVDGFRAEFRDLLKSLLDPSTRRALDPSLSLSTSSSFLNSLSPSTSHFSRQGSKTMKFLTPFLLAVAIASVSAMDTETMAPASMSTAASGSSGTSSTGSDISGSSSKGSSTPRPVGSATDDSVGPVASSNSTDVEVGDSESGSEDLSIESNPSSSDASSESDSGSEEAASAASDSRADTGSSSGAASIQSVAIYTSAAVAFAIGALL